MNGRALDALARSVEAGGRLEREQAMALVGVGDLEALCLSAARLRDCAFGNLVTVSRKVFIPLTQLCRDVCHYCTFAGSPRRGDSAYLSPEAILKIATEGARAGCDEALFTLGDKPEARYRVAREDLKALGHESTVSYLHEMAGLVLRETGLLPHINAGVMTCGEITALRQVSVSQGLMLETASERLSGPGGPHHGSPDKVPAVRLKMLDAAGQARVPFTTGILIGIGETRTERIEALLAIRELQERHGHIQEVIIQNFRAKPGTRMSRAPEPSLEEQQWTIAAARLILGPTMSIQTPPNLRAGRLEQLVGAGINDWGGVSPVTPDFVNPEMPWPHLTELADATARAGKTLVPRLAIYGNYLRDGRRWLDPACRSAVLRRSDGAGLAHETGWRVGRDRGECDHGLGASPPFTTSVSVGGWAPAIDRGVGPIIDRLYAGRKAGIDDLARLFAARGDDERAVLDAADQLRHELVGPAITYVVNRNINYTNVCGYRCGFCAFSKGSSRTGLRGDPYELDLEEIQRRTCEAWSRGATEVCLQGGIHPGYTGNTYLAITRAVKSAVPGIHLHAFSPLEVTHGAATNGMAPGVFLASLREAGLGTLPGTAAEVLQDDVRRLICPDKLTANQWLDVVSVAHKNGLRTTATIMFGHVDAYEHWAVHLARLLELQLETGGFTEFVPLPFVHMEAPIYRRGEARQGPSYREAMLMHAVARLVFNRHLPNIQVSWVKMGEGGSRAALCAGANDLGGTLMNESISRAAGTTHGQEMPPIRIEAAITSLGREPRQRTTLYCDPPRGQTSRSYRTAPLSPVVEPPALKHARIC